MTISQTMRLEDRVSPVLKNISKNAVDVVKRYEEIDKQLEHLNKVEEKMWQNHLQGTYAYKQMEQATRQLMTAQDKLISGQSKEWYENNKFYQLWQQGQEGVTREVSATEAVLKRVGSLIKTVVGVYSIKQLMNMSDQLVQVEARLGLANKGGDTPEQFSNKIYAAAQRSRADYNTMASTIAKLGMQAGDAFGSNNELIKFSENLNKIFVTSGLDAGGIQSVMYNLTQSMSTGRLLGNDYRILKMNAPELVNMLKKTYAENSQEVLDEMVSKGKISGQMLKEAIIGNTKEIEEKFNKMPVTWEQAFTSIKNSTQRLLKPVLKIVGDIAGTFYEFTSNIEKNWKQIAPILSMGLAMIGAISAAMLVAKAKAAISNIALQISLKATAAAYLEKSRAALLAGKSIDMNTVSAAQNIVANNAMIVSLGKIAIALIAVVGAAYLVSYVTEKVTGQSLDALGLITAAVGLSVGVILNIVSVLVNGIIWLINFVSAAITGKWEAIYGVMLDFGVAMMEIIEWVVSGMDKIFGTDHAASFHSTVLKLKAEREQMMKDAGYENAVDYWDPGSIYDWTKKGYDVGAGFSKSISSAFDGTDLSASIQDVLGTDGTGASAIRTTSNDKLLDEEDIQLLLDVATRDYKLNYQHITPEVTVTFGDVRETADVDAVLERVVTTLEEAASGDLGMVTA